MYTEGILDLTEMMLQVVICPPDQREAKISLVKDKTKNRYLPAFENVSRLFEVWGHCLPRTRERQRLGGTGCCCTDLLNLAGLEDYLVGIRLTRVDFHLLEVLLYVEELDSSLLAPFPLLKALKNRISSLPNVKKFLQPGSQRKPPIDAKQIEEARKIFKF
ncbi:glutathione S-transferase A2-like [Arvicola amphibius]|uniref:glutathione S-transferase A2-like n=1 Tax=Arvicola amphibius TaxID=1047088 RepID=UPI001C098FBD|nr:glutathione S-transferase A2-like [Arvicola amphibius]